jgi:hypothetical protein
MDAKYCSVCGQPLPGCYLPEDGPECDMGKEHREEMANLPPPPPEDKLGDYLTAHQTPEELALPVQEKIECLQKHYKDFLEKNPGWAEQQDRELRDLCLTNGWSFREE